ncbi:uncharacterized protein F4822DRAFT_39417 [Hypoxylon trugodes]|uniref:uncharacterized protein n=1 Tax=Hypoxylon trugodes TaxID=326681 RepID=UPI00218D1F9A|nr:uncharacterized protein F4822DRAFT_39417 [Hypoxylon trugodes]KAI1394174.1 hypothetical protein F4822DRAFT_39417 [Hypoxylon trugodes]
MPAPLKYYQKANHVVAAAVSLCVVDIISVILRFYTRRRERHSLKADDWIMIPALLITIGIGICLVYGVSQGALGSSEDIPPELLGSALDVSYEQLGTAFKVEFSTISMLPLTLGSVKASFLFFYRRIFSVNKTTDKFLISMIVTVAIWTVTFFFAVVFECGLNFWAIWGDSLKVENLTAHCVKTMDLALSIGITDFITDVVIIIIPVPLIWRLNLSTGKKIAASAVFLLGAVTIGASLTRLIIITQDRHKNVVFNPHEDEILVITEYLYWGMIECGVGVFVACLPTLQFLLREFSFKSIIDSTGSLLGSRESKMEYVNTNRDIHVGRTFGISFSERRSTSTRSLPMHARGISRDSHTLKTEAYPMGDYKNSGAV